jgi:cell division septum initiation protein DivIVA
LILSALVGSGSGFFASQTEHPSVLLVLGAALAGVIAPLVLVFLWSFLTIPRRHLEWRTEELEQQVEALQAQMSQFLEEKHGDPLQFLSIYHELRADVREAIRIIKRAEESGELWSRTAAPEYRNWKRHRGEIASNPFARLDGLHGELLEAFDHVERLATKTALRIGRRVRRSDDLDVALKSLGIAEDRLTFSINRLEALQSPPELWQSTDDFS